MRVDLIGALVAGCGVALALSSAAHARPGFASPSLESVGGYRRSVFNNDPLQTAFVEFLFTDENCLRVSSAIHVAPGHHGSGTVPAGVPTGPVNCIVQFPTANKVSGGNLTVGFYAVANGQATAAIPVTNFRLNLPVCK